MLAVKDVYKSFNPNTVNETVALCDVNFEMKEGEFITLIGGNGAGKSTLLNCVAGVYSVDRGTILIDNVDVTRLPEHKRAAVLGRGFRIP